MANPPENNGEHPDFARVKHALAAKGPALAIITYEVRAHIEEAARRYGTSKLLRSDTGQERLRERCEGDTGKFLESYAGRSSLNTYIAVRVIKMIPTVYTEIVADATGGDALSKRERERLQRLEHSFRARKALYERYAHRLLELRPEHRDVFIMYYRDGKSHRKIAEKLGLTEDNVRQRKVRARQALKISNDEEAED